MPVSPLSMTQEVMRCLLCINPDLKVIVLGGDQSVTWPVLEILGPQQSEPWGIVHLDAHPDLAPDRFGVPYSFTTWAFHARQLLVDPEAFVQVGIRAGGKDRITWEDDTGVRQFWADEVGVRPQEVAAAVCQHLESLGIARLYISNDISATDGRLVPATGAPVADGLSPAWILAFIDLLAKNFTLFGIW